ncbi:transposase [Nocardia sp. NEAU-G5]|uniref:Transposase n=1 Tax=Nocardia albiluteola TaxID=2842303 RepID=A0ABS6BCP2_9NOCA|nr:transposase [Nocardia albiluteola]
MTSVSVTRRANLTDAQWARLAPLLPRGMKAGRPPKWTKRQLIDGIRPKTFRRRLFSIPARLARHARRTHLRLSDHTPRTGLALTVLTRLQPG